MIKFQNHKFSVLSDGEPLAADLALAGPRAPLLVLAHGFGGNKNEGGLFTQAKHYFGQNGFSVLRFDFRGCGENSGSFKRIRLQHLVNDIHSVFSYIKSNRRLEALPVGFVGFSLGAGIGLLAGLPVDAYVFWSPAIFTRTDMVPRYLHELDAKGFIIKGNIKVSKDFIHDLNSDAIPNSLRSVRSPVLIVHGTSDQRIPFYSSEKAKALLQGTARRSKVVLIQGADHSFRNDPYCRQQVFSESLNWLQESLFERLADSDLSARFHPQVSNHHPQHDFRDHQPA